MTAAQPLTGFAFPMITVKHYGPTNYRAGRFVATLRQYDGATDTAPIKARAEVSDQSEEGSSSVLMSVAVACWDRYRATLVDTLGFQDDDPRVMVPFELPSGFTGYAVVPAYMVTVTA